jgi:hypothetical protein
MGPPIACQPVGHQQVQPAACVVDALAARLDRPLIG